MSDRSNRARLARENLAGALGALQTQGLPAGPMDAAEPIAAAMGALHRIEVSGDAALTDYAPRALMGARRALAMLQDQGISHPAVDEAIERIASSLGLVHGMTADLPASPGAQAPPGVPADDPAQPMWRQPPSPHDERRAPIWQESAHTAQLSQEAAARGERPDQGRQEALPNPAAQPRAPHEVQQSTAGGPVGQASPAARSPRERASAAGLDWQAQQHYGQGHQQQVVRAPQGQRQPGVDWHTQSQRGYPQEPAVVPGGNPSPPAGPPAARAAFATDEQHAAFNTGERPSPANVVGRHAPPPEQVAPVASRPQASLPTSPSQMRVGIGSGLARIAGAPQGHGEPVQVEANLGVHSPSNFYKGLSGNDVVDSGGVFITTYRIPQIGRNVALRISLPGGYEFEAKAVVRWTREASDATGHSAPGFGAQFTEISPEGRQLVYRYVRNREPLFHDDDF